MAQDPRTATVNHLRETAAHRAESTSLRGVAREMGMSPTGLKKFLLGTTPYSPTLRRLRAWYVLHGAKRSDSLDHASVKAALDLLTQDVSAEWGREVRTTFLRVLARGYDERGTRPQWLVQMMDEVLG